MKELLEIIPTLPVRRNERRIAGRTLRLALGCLPQLGLFAVLGCAKAPPALRLDGVGVSEASVPLVYALRVTNYGGSAAVVDSATINVLNLSVIAPGAAMADVPKDLECRVSLVDGDGLRIEPGETIDVHCILEWQTSPDPPPMIAVVRATFGLGPDRVESEPLSFILQNQPGLLEAACENRATPEQDAALLELLRQFEGKRSAGFMRLLKSVERWDDTA